MQLWMKDNVVFRHFVGIVAFFFLFTVLDQKNQRGIKEVWTKTIIVYAVFVLMTKSKWYFSLPVLILLVIDQNIRIHVQDIKKRSANDGNETTRKYEEMQRAIDVLLGILVVMGAGHYAYRQKKEFKDDFGWNKFFLMSKCKV